MFELAPYAGIQLREAQYCDLNNDMILLFDPDAKKGASFNACASEMSSGVRNGGSIYGDAVLYERGTTAHREEERLGQLEDQQKHLEKLKQATLMKTVDGARDTTERTPDIAGTGKMGKKDVN